MIQEDKADWDAIIQAAIDAGATDEMIKELGAYERENNVYDDMAEWVNCVHVMLNKGVCLFVIIRKLINGRRVPLTTITFTIAFFFCSWRICCQLMVQTQRRSSPS